MRIRIGDLEIEGSSIDDPNWTVYRHYVTKKGKNPGTPVRDALTYHTTLASALRKVMDCHLKEAGNDEAMGIERAIAAIEQMQSMVLTKATA